MKCYVLNEKRSTWPLSIVLALRPLLITPGSANLVTGSIGAGMIVNFTDLIISLATSSIISRRGLWNYLMSLNDATTVSTSAKMTSNLTLAWDLLKDRSDFIFYNLFTLFLLALAHDFFLRLESEVFFSLLNSNIHAFNDFYNFQRLAGMAALNIRIQIYS